MRLGYITLLLGLLAGVAPVKASTPEPNTADALVDRVQEEWEEVFYSDTEEQQQAIRYQDFLTRLTALETQYPKAASPKVLKAMVLCTYAGTQIGLSTLELIDKARELLQQAITLDPKALKGSAYITLGNLYQRLPGWPISFGDDHLAKTYLETALKLFPEAMDTNYFYGSFLVDQGQYEEAVRYLGKADQIPLPASPGIADQKLKQHIHHAIRAAEAHQSVSDDFFSRLLPDWLLTKP
ncbi:MAG: hypothetical protein ACR2HF_12280 [Methylococcaceae bacterium]